MSAQLPLPFERRQGRDSFVIHAGNVEAVQTIDAWPDWPGGVLVLVGPEGSGKSHLAAVWAERAGAAPLGVRDGWTSEPDKPSLMEDADRRPADEALFHRLNRAANGDVGLLLTARAAPRAWPTQVPDLRSRLNALRVVELGEPDEQAFAELLRLAFKRRQIRPSDELITFLTRRIERSALGAERAAARLDEAALATHRPVSRAVARELFGEEPELFPEDLPSHA